MAFIDYYKVMGIPKDTPQDKIKEAYRKRSKQFHPDLHPDDPKSAAKFKLLNEANEVLSDPEKRRKYDQYGENWKQADQFGGFGAGAGGAQGNPLATSISTWAAEEEASPTSSSSSSAAWAEATCTQEAVAERDTTPNRGSRRLMSLSTHGQPCWAERLSSARLRASSS